MRYAVIDLGTNTFHLLIADITQGASHIVYKTTEAVRLGAESINSNYLNDAAIERALHALIRFQDLIKYYSTSAVVATATSAVRSAVNGKEFIQLVKDKTGLEIAVLSGTEEAELIYKGVRASGAITDKSILVDIGGGSTEFIICDETQLFYMESFDLGAARLMQGFFKSDPLKNEDLKLLHSHIASTLTPLATAIEQFNPTTIIGSAGAFETFAVLLNENLDIKKTANSIINLSDYRNLATSLLASSHAERALIAKLPLVRVDMIVMAAVLTNYILEILPAESMKLSTYDLKMGVVSDLENS